MEGNLATEEGKGVIPRAVEAIFDQLRDPKYSSYTVHAQYLEIYNEELTDLLVDEDPKPVATPRPNSSGTKSGAAEPAQAYGAKLMIAEEPPKKEGDRGRVHVHNLSSHKVLTANDVLHLIRLAQQRRQVGETRMNKTSSRSHCVFTLTVASTRVTSDGGSMECKGKLHLVDLAGSECARTAGLEPTAGKTDLAHKSREAERRNINQSLLTLGRVISTLRDCMTNKTSLDSVRIPYRDSKLTRLLQESLGGRSKTVIIATLSPSVLAVEESTSTLTYAQQAHGLQNKPVATSYLTVGAPGAGHRGVGVDAEGVGDGKSMQDWSTMLARMAYLENQKNEATAMLAKKHLEQEELEKRAFLAESERNEKIRELGEKTEECEKLSNELELKENELKLHEFLLSSRASTESRLSKQARKLLQSLADTESEAQSLHDKLHDAARQIDAQTERRVAFHETLVEHLVTARAGLSALSIELEQERATSLQAATEGDSTLAQHADSIGSHAAAMASVGAAERARAERALAQVREATGTSLQDACERLTSNVTACKEAAQRAQGDVATRLCKVVDAIGAAQAALSTSVDTSVGRQSATEQKAKSDRTALSDAIKQAAVDAGTRLQAERARLETHAAAMRTLLAEVRRGHELEQQAREALASLTKQESANGAAATERMAAIVAAIEHASASQHEHQQDGAMLEGLADADALLNAAHEQATRTIAMQRATLDAARQAQHAGDASATTATMLAKTRAAADAAAAARVFEAEAAAAKLAAQQEGLRKLLEEQSTLRTALMADVMAAVQSTLSTALEESLSVLAKRASSGVEVAVEQAAELVLAATATSIGATKANEAAAAQTAALLQVTTAWGEATKAVGIEIGKAIDAADTTTTQIAEGGAALEAAHESLACTTRSWAASDAECRSALGRALEMQNEAIGESQVSTAEQALAISEIDAEIGQLIELSGAADASISCGIEAVKVGGAALGAIEAASTATSEGVNLALEGIGEASEAARKNEAAALVSISTAAERAAASVSSELEIAITLGGAATAKHVETAAAIAAAAAAAAEKHEALMTSHASAEMSARAAAAARAAEHASAAAAAASAHMEAATAIARARAAAAVSAAEAQATSLAAQTVTTSAMSSSVEAFVAASSDEPVPVPERSPQHFSEPLAKTADEEVLRRHYEANGPTPLEAHETVMVQPTRRLSIKAVKSPGTARTSQTGLMQPSARMSLGKSTIVSATTATEQENMPAATNGSPTNSAGGAMKQKQRMSVAEKEAHEKGVREELKGLKVAELKQLCGLYEVADSGTKEVIIARLAKVANVDPKRLQQEAAAGALVKPAPMRKIAA
jgi:kinesin family protein 11